MSDEQEMVIYQVRIRAEDALLLQGYAAREGATPEALAALWIEEKLAEARANLASI